MKQSELSLNSTLSAEKRREPRLWVKELAVYREWNPNALQRRISLRQGLNIIWAEPTEQGAGGHAAGKTTFCRFLRYLLGDPNFGNETFRDAFRRKFPNAWLVGEVRLDGVPWLVARFIGITGSPHWSARDVGFDRLFDEQVERQTYADFVRELQKTFIEPLPIDILPGSGKAVEWAHLLAWLSRDQEARYDHVLDWRSAYSGSGGLGDLHNADRTLLVRTALGLTQGGELKARQDHMRILREKADCEALIPKLVFARERTEPVYRKLMEVAEGTTITESTLLVEEKALASEKTRLESRVRELRRQDGIGDVLPTERDALVTKLVMLSENSKALETEKKRVKLDISFKEGNISDEEYRKQLAQMPLRADQCSAPLDWEPTRQCKVAQMLHANRFSEHLLAELESTAGSLKAKAQGLEQEAVIVAAEQIDATKKKDEVENRIAAARRRHQDNIQTFEDELSAVRDKHAVTVQLRELIEEAEVERKKSDQLQTEQRKSTEFQDSLRQKASNRQSELSEIFATLAGCILQSGDRGSVRFLAEEIKLELDYNDLTSTALITLKILIFDLAALFASARQAEGHPGFLIHDSPREADLTAAIYRRIFDKVHEEDHGDSPTPFQYVITTTEPPPESLRCKPWLVHPPFSSADKERRFLRENL